MIYTRQLLEIDTLKKIQSLIPNLKWQDGMVTASTYHDDTKIVEQAIHCPNYSRISELVYESLDLDHKFLDLTIASGSTNVIISKTSEGGHYRPHQDDYTSGHFSTTIFLNEPDEYDGGELTLNYGGDYKHIKLPAGNAVTYGTGIPHCVNEVTRGSRYVAILWTTSKILDPFMREVCANLNTIRTLLPAKAKTLEEAEKDPHFIADMTYQNILRAYATK